MPISDIIGAERIYSAIEAAIANKTLVKAVFSRPRDKSVVRSVIALFEKNGDLFVSIDTFMRDGKDIRKNASAVGGVYSKL